MRVQSKLVCRSSRAFQLVKLSRWLAPPAKLCRPCRGLLEAAPHTTIHSENVSVVHVRLCRLKERGAIRLIQAACQTAAIVRIRNGTSPTPQRRGRGLDCNRGC